MTDVSPKTKAREWVDREGIRVRVTAIRAYLAGYSAALAAEREACAKIAGSKLHALAASLASGMYANEIADVRREIESAMRGQG
jgi:hypothetical protein